MVPPHYIRGGTPPLSIVNQNPRLYFHSKIGGERGRGREAESEMGDGGEREREREG